jgi:hypothetical protein
MGGNKRMRSTSGLLTCLVATGSLLTAACVANVGTDGEASEGDLDLRGAERVSTTLTATNTALGAMSDAGAAQYCAVAGGKSTSKWAYVGTNGKLTYPTLTRGDHVLDFSNAGYGGGGASIPNLKVVRSVAPSGKDDTATIQAALNAVSALPLVSGLRGAVLLAPGTFHLAGSLSIAASGVVLRGSGSGTSGTLVQITGSPRMAVTIGGTGNWIPTGTPTTVTDSYVPSGSRTFHVANAAGLTVGSSILITRTVTQAWVHFMGMDTLTDSTGAAETWLAPGTTMPSDRVITAISGNTITVDAPLSDALDAAYTGPTGVTVRPYTYAARVQQVGLESIHFVAPKQTVPISQATYDFLDMSAVANAWVHDVIAEEFSNGYTLEQTAKWVTIQDATDIRTAAVNTTAGLPFAFSIDGQLTLVQRIAVQANNVFAYGTKSRSLGPNVLLDAMITGVSSVEPHERWATGLLTDNVSLPSGGVQYVNLGTEGTGHGWAMGFGVVWNSYSSGFTVQAPPGSENWLIGPRGVVAKQSTGIVDSAYNLVLPSSLYLAQLCERLGPQAITNIGF